jgi:hypothetical protein
MSDTATENIACEPEYVSLKHDDGPMGFCNVTVIYSVLGAANEHYENAACAAVLEDFISDCRGRGEDKGYSQKWVDFVNAITHGQVVDDICQRLFQGVQIVAEGDGFDFLLETSAVEATMQRMDEIQPKFAEFIKRCYGREEDDFFDEGEEDGDAVE